MEIEVGQFKSKCLKLMDDVHKYHEEIIITKHGKPLAKLVPIGEKAPGSLFGYLKDSVTIRGDIVKPTGES